MSDVEVQNVVIAGTPTSGHYIIKYVDGNSNEFWTTPLAYNASEAAVQAAMRAIPGLGSVTNSQSGTTPNFTNAITFTGVDPPGNIALLTATNSFDTGSVTPGAVTVQSLRSNPRAKIAGSKSRSASASTLLRRCEAQSSRHGFRSMVRVEQNSRFIGFFSS